MTPVLLIEAANTRHPRTTPVTVDSSFAAVRVALQQRARRGRERTA